MSSTRIRFTLTSILVISIMVSLSMIAFAQESGDKPSGGDTEEIQPIPEIDTPEAPPEDEASEELAVKALDFQGNQRISDEQIIAVMVTRPGRSFSFSDIKEDLERIGEMGYFQAVPTYTAEPMSDGVKIIIFLKENPLYKGLKIEIKGPGLITEEQIRQLFDYKEGEIISTPRLLQLYEKIENEYRQKGYTAATIADAGYDDDGTVSILINEGIIKEIKVEGNTKTKDIVILREITLRPGDVYDAIKFRRDLENIFALQLFEDITVDYELTDTQEIIVIVKVTEARTGQFGFGGGYSSQDGLLATFSYTERNFRGLGQRVNLMGQIGGPNPDFMLSYYSPQIDSQRTSMTAELFMLSSTDRIRNLDDPTVFTKFTTKRKGGSLAFTRPLNASVKFNTKLSLQDGTYHVEGDEDFEETDQFEEYKRRGLIEGTSNSFLAGITKDTRDFILDPSTGYFASLSGTLFGYVLGGDFDAIKGVGEYRVYYNMRRNKQQLVTGIDPSKFYTNNVVAYRLMLGTSTGDLSIFDSFKIGGADTVRGVDDALQTGDQMILTNLEYRFPVITNLSGAVFIDSGTAAPPGETMNFGDLVTSIGGGIRYRIPFFGIAPLRLDYGYDLTNNSGRVSFGFGQLF